MSLTLPPTSSLPGLVARERIASTRRFLLCPPTHFDVTYAINPWMDPSAGVDRMRATRQWAVLQDTYSRLGHRVEVIPGEPGLPDMVFTANGALVIDGHALIARFTHEQRQPESGHHLAWFREHLDSEARQASGTNEAEGDLLVIGDVILAGTGFRTDPASHDEVATEFGREVVTLELVDPRFYHLDVALAVLDDHTIAWFPAAFSPNAQAEVRRRFPDAIEVVEGDALVLGCNAVSDGRHVIVDHRATTFIGDLRRAGFIPVPVEIDEFNKAGGGIKCLTLEIRTPAIDRATT